MGNEMRVWHVSCLAETAQLATTSAAQGRSEVRCLPSCVVEDWEWDGCWD